MKAFKTLIIEDNTALAKILASLLDTFQIQTNIARNGQTAAEFLQQNTPDLILLDLHIPEISGSTLLRQIRANDKLAHTKVVVITADMFAVRAIEHLADLILIKPLDTDKLFTFIDPLLSDTQPPRTTIYHITSADSWAAAQKTNQYTADSLQIEGFIHCSTKAQVLPVANNFYHGQQGLVLLCIAEKQVKTDIKYEDSHQNGELFPHIYGPLNLDAVTQVVPFPTQEDGSFTLPSLP